MLSEKNKNNSRLCQTDPDGISSGLAMFDEQVLQLVRNIR
jgi:hypothetical protein